MNHIFLFLTIFKEESNRSVIDLTGVEQALVDWAVAESLETSLTPTNTLPTFVY